MKLNNLPSFCFLFDFKTILKTGFLIKYFNANFMKFIC